MRKDGYSRREFLAVAGAAPISASLVSGMAAETKPEAKAPSSSGKLKFSCMVTLEDWSRSVQIFVDVAQPRGNIRFGGWSFGGEWGTATVETPHVAGDGVSVKNGRYVVTCNAQLPAVTLPLAQLQACPQALPGWRATKAQGLLTIELFGGSRPTRVLTCREQAIAAGR